MGDTEDDWMSAPRLLVGALVVFAITWYLFWEVIQPTLVSISPIFASNPDGYVGRYPDNAVQVALFATALLGLFVYFLFEILISKGTNEFMDSLEGIYVIISLPIVMFKNDVLPVFGIDRWVHDPTEENHQKDSVKSDE